MRYEIIDNFLNDQEFTELKNNILPPSSCINWAYINKQVPSESEQDRFKKVTDIEPLNSIHQWYFAHELWCGAFQSPVLGAIGKLLDKMKSLTFYRIQANFTVQQEKRGRSLFHIDYEGPPLKDLSMVTSIYYVNTTNGPTLLEDGTEIECRANRLVTYPYNTYHAGVLCTDQPYKVVINFNYFREVDF